MGIMLSSIGHDSVFVVVDSEEAHAQGNLPPWAAAADAAILEEVALLPTFRGAAGRRFVLRADLEDSRDAFAHLTRAVLPNLFGGTPLSIMIGATTRVDLAVGRLMTNPAYYAGLRNLCRLVRKGVERDAPVAELAYFEGGRIETTSRLVVGEVERQLARAEAVAAADAGQFAHSAYYMGSKRALRGFLAEAIGSTLSEQGMVVDLMCGSGAASGAFSRLWCTVASDAQEFCRVLARVQGGGYRRAIAEARMEEILGLARENAELLRKRIGDALKEEEELFHSDLNEETVERYRQFISRWPTYPDGSPRSAWNPVSEVRKRQRDSGILPYCLFTAYYANVYFGLRQAIEIDGLRYGIDRLQDGRDRVWALGALIASASALGSTFGGHFAQPPIRRSEDLDAGNVGPLIEGRAASITHEFCARYLNLASASEKTRHAVETVPGPWQACLDSIRDRARGRKDVTVYVDAPYTRDEYSRYYHVLETLVNYRYPDSIGIGRVPSKARGGRFRSEFFTRSKRNLVDALCSVILAVLERGWVCAWSYSDHGGVRIPYVVDEVRRRMRCEVRSYAAPYRHKALGARQAKPVVEHVVIFRRD